MQVSVRVLGGLMSLGYEISVVMNRHSVVYTGADVSVKFDTIEGIPGTFVQIQVLCGHCLPHTRGLLHSLLHNTRRCTISTPTTPSS